MSATAFYSAQPCVKFLSSVLDLNNPDALYGGISDAQRVRFQKEIMGLKVCYDVLYDNLYSQKYKNTLLMVNQIGISFSFIKLYDITYNITILKKTIIYYTV